MPLYEYQCELCGNRFEVIQRFSDPALTACRQCGGAVRKLLSAPAIQFKGTGWYVTDYARKGGSGGGEATDAPKAKTGEETSKSGGESASGTAGGTDSTGSGSGSGTSGNANSASTTGGPGPSGSGGSSGNKA